MKKVLPVLFALAFCSGPVFAWGGGDCSFSKERPNQEASPEKVEKSDSSKKN